MVISADRLEVKFTIHYRFKKKKEVLRLRERKEFP